MAVSCF